MNEVRVDPRQAPAHAELLLGADFGRQAPGRPIRLTTATPAGGRRGAAPTPCTSASRTSPPSRPA